MKLTEAQKSAAIAYGRVLQERIPPCPWNPFPRDSDWGREIERHYVEAELKRRRAGRTALEEQDGR